MLAAGPVEHVPGAVVRSGMNSPAAPALIRSGLQPGSWLRGTSRATGRPRSVTVIDSPATTRLTTADAFCFKARIPISAMFYNVAHVPGWVVSADGCNRIRGPVMHSTGNRCAPPRLPPSGIGLLVERARRGLDRIHQCLVPEKLLGFPELG